MILIFVEQITPRLEYIFEVIFKNVLKVNFSLTTDSKIFKEYSSIKFSYAARPLTNEVFFKSHSLLFQDKIFRQEIENISSGEHPIFFKVSDGALSFDPFACSFYLVSRYEEYLEHVKDQYGRYPFYESLAFKGGFLERPVVNIWSLQIKRVLQEKFPDYSFPALQFRYRPTIDIDNAYAYKYKGILRTLLSFSYLALLIDYKKIYQRILVLLGFKKDPFDTYEKQFALHKRFNIHPLYFILLANYGRYDKNISYRNKYFQGLIKKLTEYGDVGIHPSFNSNSKLEILKEEKRRLESILNKEVIISRNHYIKIDLPATYKNLIEAGIREDYSMGYPEAAGFRAGIATPYYFYDLGSETKTILKVFPFVIMDVTLKKYLRIRSKDVPMFIKPIIEECKSVGGEFLFIFHNESLSGEGVWKNWSEVYEKFLETINE